MLDNKKSIGPEVETPTKASAPKQTAPDKAEPAVTDHAPAGKAAFADKAEPAAPESPGAAAPEQPKPEQEAQQTAIPDKGDPAQAPSGKVVDFAAARDEAAKDKGTAKASRGCPAKADKAARGKSPSPGVLDKVGLLSK